MTRVFDKHYTLPELYNFKINEVMYNILINFKEKTNGCYSGQTLLNKYGLIIQVPLTITILTTIPTRNLTVSKFSVNKLANTPNNKQMIKVLTKSPLIFEFLELCYLSQFYSLKIDITFILEKFCNYNNLNVIDFCAQFLRNEMPNGYLYNVQRTVRKILLQVVKENNE